MKLAKKYDKLPFALRLILTVFFDIVVGAVYRILIAADKKNTKKLVLAVLWLPTCGYLGIGWICDVVTLITKGKYTLLI